VSVALRSPRVKLLHAAGGCSCARLCPSGPRRPGLGWRRSGAGEPAGRPLWSTARPPAAN